MTWFSFPHLLYFSQSSNKYQETATYGSCCNSSSETAWFLSVFRNENSEEKKSSELKCTFSWLLFELSWNHYLTKQIFTQQASYYAGNMQRLQHRYTTWWWWHQSESVIRRIFKKKKLRKDFPGGSVQEVGVQFLVRELRFHVPHGQKNQNIKQKQYCNKFNGDFKNGLHQKKLKIKNTTGIQRKEKVLLVEGHHRSLCGGGS